MNSYRYSLFLIAAAAVLLAVSGCIPDAPLVPKRVSMSFLAEGVGDGTGELTSNDDTLTVSEIKLYLDSFILETEGEARLRARQQVILFYEDAYAGNESFQFASEMGYDDFNTFTGFEFNISPPPADLNINDQDLVTDGERFSIVMKGTYNGDDFLYKSKAELNRLLNFSSDVHLDDDAETLKLRVVIDVADVMVDGESGRILSPTDPDDASQIDSQIEQSIRVEASAKSAVPTN